MLTRSSEIQSLFRGRKNLGGEFLSQVMRRLRSKQPYANRSQTWYVRYDTTRKKVYAQLWFLTQGCRWDKLGSCTMCNYGRAAQVGGEEMISFVRAGLSSIDRPVKELYISPSGSFLDRQEVPVEVRRAILELVKEFPVRYFSFETRPETVTVRSIRELKAILPDKKITIGFGVESVSPWILRYCINKPNTIDNTTRVTRILSEAKIGIDVNISLGSAFLSVAEAIDDAVRSVRWALRSGAQLALVFPMHVKNYTLLEWMFSRGLYKPPSLWSLVEVLKIVGPSLVSRVNIAWYKPDYGANPGVIASPTTCPNCEGKVLTILDEYRAKPSVEIIERLDRFQCECQTEWKTTLSTQVQPLPDRIFEIYSVLAENLGINDWWRTNSEALRVEMSQ